MKFFLVTIILFMFQTYSIASDKLDISWVGKKDIDSEQMTLTLNQIQAMSKEEANAALKILDEGKSKFPPVGKTALDFLRAAILLHMDKRNEAEEIYKRLSSKMKNNEYGVSAGLILLFNKKSDNKTKEKKLKEFITAYPKMKCWSLAEGKWSFSPVKQLCLEEIVKLRADDPDFRFFNSIKSYSIFSTSYSYLFVLLIIALVFRICFLPADHRFIKESIKTFRIQPQIKLIKEKRKYLPAKDVELELIQLYKTHKINVARAGVIAFYNIIWIAFIIWILKRSMYPCQMIIDKSKFLWINDVTMFSFSIIILFVIVQLLIGTWTVITRTTTWSIASIIYFNLFAGLVLLAAGWYWQWSAYIFIFWGMFNLIGTILHTIIIETVLISGYFRKS